MQFIVFQSQQGQVLHNIPFLKLEVNKRTIYIRKDNYCAYNFNRTPLGSAFLKRWQHFFATTNLSNHLLKDATVANRLEDFVGDSLGDAVQTLLHKGFPLKEKTHSGSGSSAGGELTRAGVRSHLSVEAGGRLEEELADLVHAVRVAGGVLQAGEESTAHGNSVVQTLGHFSWKRNKIYFFKSLKQTNKQTLNK